MSLYSYLSKSSSIYYELEDNFEEGEIMEVHKLLIDIKVQGYFSFVANNIDDIQKYISLSPSQRKQKKWLNHKDNLLIRFAALQISFATVEMIKDLHPLGGVLDGGGSYRSFHSITADALSNQLLRQPLFYFPFSSFTNPFI